MRTETLHIVAGHGSATRHGLVTFDLDNGMVLDQSLPFSVHEWIATTWLKLDIDAAKAKCAELQGRFGSDFFADCYVVTK